MAGAEGRIPRHRTASDRAAAVQQGQAKPWRCSMSSRRSTATRSPPSSPRKSRRQGRAPRLFVQVNTGSEPQKAGIEPRDAVAFVARCRDVHGLPIEGLMCIPPADENPGPHFALLEKLAREAGVAKLSMGMSGDYETAIAFGATSVRVGSAIFGSR